MRFDENISYEEMALGPGNLPKNELIKERYFRKELRSSVKL